MFLSWIDYTYQTAMLGMDCQRVIGLRLTKISAGGPAAGVETALMVNEKIAAAMQSGLVLATGGSPHKVLRHYRSKVKANMRRLARKT